MKFNSALSLALAPVALAKSARNKFPVRRNPSLGGVNAIAPIAPVALAPIGGAAQVDVIVVWVNQGGPNGVAQTLNQQVTVTQTVTVPAGGVPSIVAGADGVQTTVQPGQSAVIPNAPGTTHTVEVGGPRNKLTFNPPELKAEQGSFILFNFYAANHSVTQAAFDTPCVAMAGGMDSGFMANPNNTDPPPQVAMQVLTTEPLWMYCAQGNHCGNGMTFSVNAGIDRTAAQFQANAIAQFGQQQQTGITGGAPGAQAPAAPAAPPADANAPLAPAPGAPLDPLASPASLGGAPSIASVAFDPLASAPIANGALGGGIVMGQGVLDANGGCNCAVQCAQGVGGFPDAAVQGVDSFGGVGGAIDIGNAAAPLATPPPVRR